MENSNYNELKNFKIKLKEGWIDFSYKPYSTKLKTLRTYQFIFFGLSAVFAFLSYFLFKMHMHPFYNQVFVNPNYIKAVFFALSTLGTVATTCIGFAVRPETEAVRYLTKQGKQKLKRLYGILHSQLKPAGYIPFVTQNETLLELKHRYHDTDEQLSKIEQQAQDLVLKIVKTAHVERELKELLLNQAMLELRDRMEELIEHFQKNALSAPQRVEIALNP